MTETIRLDIEIPDRLRGRRLDQALAELVPDYSRSRLQQWIRGGQVTIDDRAATVREAVIGGEQVRIVAQPVVEARAEPEAIALDIVHQDDEVLVVNKPAGLVVHPAAGNPAGTLLNALLHHDAGLAALPRAGIVHRLDKNTTGLMVVARTLRAHTQLVKALQARDVNREYLAVVNGVLTAGATIDAPIGRHSADRKRMAVVSGGKPAVTHYRVESRYRAHSLVRVKLETGRTHQIRVHMAHAHHAVFGDPVYGGRLRLPAGAGDTLREMLTAFRRQALHATRLEFAHPATQQPLCCTAEMPADMSTLVDLLQQDLEAGSDGA